MALAKLQLDKLNAIHQEEYASNRQLEEQESTLLDSQARYQEYQRQLLNTSQKIVQAEQQPALFTLNMDNLLIFSLSKASLITAEDLQLFSDTLKIFRIW